MSYGTYFGNEYYECPNCGGKFNVDEVRDNWKCPDCNVHNIW